MNIDEVKELMERFENSNMTEFLWNDRNDILKLVKEVDSSNKVGKDKEIGAIIKDNGMKDTEYTDNRLDILVKSPLVGIVYLKPSPEKKNFVEIGEKVRKGQILLIIEAMKIMNEITAPEDGIVGEILVDSGHLVEYGEPLFKII